MVGVTQKDLLKLKVGRKDLLLAAKRNKGNLSQSSVSPTAKLRKF